MELCQSKSFCIFDDHHGSFWNVYSYFNHRSRDEDFIFSGFKFFHNFLFFFGFESPVQKSDLSLKFWIKVLDLFIFCQDRLDFIQCLAFFDQRSDDKHFLIFIDFIHDPSFEFSFFCTGDDFSFDGFSPLGQLINNTDIKFSEKCNSHRSWDRSCTHLEDMGRSKLFEKSSLFDSEFMLFIDDDILEIVKLDPFL